MNDWLHRVVGIDLGTTYSAVAAFNSFTDSPEIIHDPIQGKPHGVATPSVVWLNRSREVIVGEEAKRAIASEPENTIIEIKREMGERFSEELLDKYGARGVFRVGHPSDPVGDPSDPVKVFFAGEWLLPQEISALILMRMKQVAEAELGGEIHDAVITVPAYFTEPRKAATKEAALLAGLYPRQLIPEPTAAAICYGVDTAQLERKVYLVYDLGGGTFDVSIIVVQEDRIDVIATSGDPRLGGGDFDDAITGWVLPRLGIDASANPGLVRKIKANAEGAKRALALNEMTEIVLPPLPDGQAPPPMPLERSTFESLIEATLRKSLAYVDDAISEAQKVGFARDAIDAVLLVGGSTRIPLVKRMLLEHFGKPEEFVRTDVDPDTVVARGAAIVARPFAASKRFVMAEQPEATLLSQDVEDRIDFHLIADHTLGVGIQENRVDPLIRRGSNIPYKVTKADYVNPKDATNVRCVIYQGEGEYAFDNELIGTVELGEIDPRPEGYYRFEVTFSLDRDGLLSVRVKNLTTHQEYEAKFEQNTRIGKNEALDARRSWLEQLYDQGQMGRAVPPPVGEPPGDVPRPVSAAAPVGQTPVGQTPASQTPASAAMPTAEPPQPAPAAEPAPSGAGVTSAVLDRPAAPELLEIQGDVPVEFRATVRRVQRFLLQEPDERLVAAHNAFAAGLNATAPDDRLEELGDELADVFDDVRLHLR